MAYKNESYKQNTGSICERCYTLYGIRKDDTKERLVILTSDTTNSSCNIYCCVSCIEDILSLLLSTVNYQNKIFHLTRDGMLAYGDPNSRKSKVGPDNLRATMSRYELEGRDMLKRIRTFEGKYTDRNRVCKDIQDLLKNVFSAVEMYLQKT